MTTEIMQDLYQEAILDELKNPQNYGELTDADVVVDETNASCGDAVTVFITFNDIGYSHSESDHPLGEILDIRWVGVGCAISQAAMSLLSEKIKVMTKEDVLQLNQKDMEELLGIEEISVGRIKCMMLGLKAVHKALRDL